MLFQSALGLALLAGPLAVSAAGELGWCLGNTNTDASCKAQSDYEADFAVLKQYGSVFRTYTSDGCDTAKNIVPAAKAAGVKVVLGVWPDTDESFEADKAALQSVVPGNEDTVYAITVGSETLYRGNFTGSELLEKIQEVQKLFPSTTIGTADSWNKYADGTADAVISGGVKLLLVNGFSYWQGDQIKNATHTYFDDMMQAFSRIQNTAGSVDAVEIWTGETGWPTTGGTNYESAIAGTGNAAMYWSSGVCGMMDWGVNVFYFEAFDEPNKGESIGSNGEAQDETHWGAFTSDRTAKFDLSC